MWLSKYSVFSASSAYMIERPEGILGILWHSESDIYLFILLDGALLIDFFFFGQRALLIDWTIIMEPLS